jgi:hypothetical protein
MAGASFYIRTKRAPVSIILNVYFPFGLVGVFVSFLTVVGILTQNLMLPRPDTLPLEPCPKSFRGEL